MSHPRIFLLASGALLILWAITGFVFLARDEPAALGQYFLFDAWLNIFHAATGAVALAAGLAPMPERLAKRIALAFGIFSLTVAVIGFASPNLFGYPARVGSRSHLELGENLTHLILGMWGAYVGTQDDA